MTIPLDQIAKVVSKTKPEFEKAIRIFFTTPYRLTHAFDVAEGTNSITGIKTRIVCYLVVLPADKVASFEEQLESAVRTALLRTSDETGPR